MRDMIAHRGRRDADWVGLTALGHPVAPSLAANRAFFTPVEILPFDGHAAGQEVADDHVPMTGFEMPQHGLEVVARVAPPNVAGRHPAQLAETVGVVSYAAPPRWRVQIEEENELRLGIHGQLVGNLFVQAVEIVLARSGPDRWIGVVVRHAGRAQVVGGENHHGVHASIGKVSQRFCVRGIGVETEPARRVRRLTQRRSQKQSACNQEDATLVHVLHLRWVSGEILLSLAGRIGCGRNARPASRPWCQQ